MDRREVFDGELDRLIEAFQGVSIEVIRSFFQDTSFEALVVVIERMISQGFDADVICALIELDHDTATRELWQGSQFYLLHCACSFSAPTQVIALLITLNRRALFAPADLPGRLRGMLPLHLVCCQQTPRLETIQLLLLHHPNAASRGDKRAQCLPLHFALLTGLQDEEIIMALIDFFPEGARMMARMRAFRAFGSDLLPLHLAYKYPSVVRRLVDIFPDGARQALNGFGTYGLLPIHICCQDKDAPFETIQILLEKHPEGAMEAITSTGSVPLHYAASSGHDLDVVQLLIDAYPEALRTANVGGKLPLHLLCRSGDSRNGDGRSAHALRVLLSRDPNTVGISDNDGELALHAACSHDAIPGRFDCLRFLLQADPFTILCLRNDGMSALQISFDSRQDDRSDARDTRRYLLEKQEKAVRLLHDSLKPAMDYYNVPDLPVSIIWTFALHKIWRPTKEQIASIRNAH